MNNIKEIIKSFVITEQLDKVVMFNVLASHFNEEELSNIYAYSTGLAELPDVPSPAYHKEFKGEVKVIRVDYCRNEVEIEGDYYYKRYFDNKEDAEAFNEANGQCENRGKYYSYDEYKYVGYATSVTTSIIPISSLSSTPFPIPNN